VPLYARACGFLDGLLRQRPFERIHPRTSRSAAAPTGARFEAGRYIEFERVRDWWGRDLPVSRGAFNFDTVRYEFYRDRDVAFEGFTGRNYLYREEFTARIWNTRYDFPAVKDGRVRQETLPDDTPSGAQGWFINTRRDKFKDPRVREALICAFDFEDQHDHHVRRQCGIVSPFQNSTLMASARRRGRAGAARAVPRPGADEVVGARRAAVSRARGRIARCSARGRTLAGRRLAVKDVKRARPAASLSASSSCSTSRRSSPTTRPTSRTSAPSASTPASAVVDRCSSAPASTIRFRSRDRPLHHASTPGDALRRSSSQVAHDKALAEPVGIMNPALER